MCAIHSYPALDLHLGTSAVHHGVGLLPLKTLPSATLVLVAMQVVVAEFMLHLLDGPLGLPLLTKNTGLTHSLLLAVRHSRSPAFSSIILVSVWGVPDGGSMGVGRVLVCCT